MPADPTISLPSASAPAHLQELGPFKTIRVLGAGGMGTVYLAELQEDRPYAKKGSRVALKVLHPDLVRAAEALTRFMREAKLGASVKHRSVVRTHDADTYTSGDRTWHYLVLEYVEGRTLRELMDHAGALPEALLRHLGAQVAHGLSAIHDAGAVHRDLKPGNILITPDHEVKLMDLGVARLLDDALQRTTTGHFVGTLNYAAPEQFRGASVGPEADLYALGVTLYEAATGVQPFAADSFAAVLQKHLSHVPPRARELRSDLTPFLDELVATLLQKDASRRLSSARELAGVLEHGEDSTWWGRREPLARAAASSGHQRLRVARELPIVGRDDELESLKAAWQDVRAGSGRVVVLEGEAGVGKTRLLDEMLRALDATAEDFHLLAGSTPPTGTAGGRGPMTEAIVQQFGDRNLESQLRPYLPETPALVAAFASVLTGRGSSTADGSLDQGSLHALFCNLARSLACEKPLAWIVEDVQYATADAQSALLSLAREIENERVMLIVTTQGGPADAIAALTRLPHVRRLRLDRLGPDSVQRLLAEAFKSEALASDLGRRFSSRSDGNPFFLLEMVRELKDRGVVKKKPDGAWAVAGELSAFHVPSTVKEMVVARLTDLGRDERLILDAAAVQGHRFDADLLALVLRKDPLEVLQVLAEVQRRTALIRATGAEFEFDHHQVQEVLRDALPERLRAEYHVRLAAAYETVHGIAALAPEAVPGDAAVFVVEHSLRGLLPGGRTVQPTCAQLLPRALGHLAFAYHHEALLDLAELAVGSLGESDPALRCDVRLRQAECLTLLGRRREERAAVQDALAAAQQLGDQARIAKARCALGRLLLAVSDFTNARVELEAAATQAAAAGDPATEGRALGYLGLVHEELGDYERARAMHQRFLERAEQLHDKRGVARAIGSLGSIWYHLGDHEKAREHQDRRVALCREIGDRRGETIGLGILGSIHFAMGQTDEARQCHERSLQLARSIGDRHGEAMASGKLGSVLLQLGRPDEARRHHERDLALCRAMGDRQATAAASGKLGTLHWHLGELRTARDYFVQHLATCVDVGDRKGEAVALIKLGMLCLDEGRLDEADERLGEGLRVSRELGVRRSEAHALRLLGDLARARKDTTRAVACYEEALTTSRALDVRLGTAECALALGRLHAEQGNTPAARPLLVMAAALVDRLRLGSPGPLPAAYLALMRARDPATVSITDASPAAVRAEAHLVLDRVGIPGHLDRAKEIMAHSSSHLSGADSETFWRNVLVAREIQARGGAAAR